MKGTTLLVAMIILTIISIGLVGSFLFFAKPALESTTNQTEKKTKRSVKIRGSNFYIKEINGNNLTIINNGKTNLPVESFSFYLKDKKVKAEPYRDVEEIAPGEEIVFNVSMS